MGSGKRPDARAGRTLKVSRDVKPGRSSAVAAGFRHSVALKADGTVVATGENKYGQCDVSDWRDIVAVAVGNAHTGNSHTVGLRSDGTVVAVGWNKYGQCDVQGWRNVVAVAAGSHHAVALKADGTVVAAGRNDHGQCNVDRWREVVAIAAGCAHTVAVTAGGTAFATGLNSHGQCEVSRWTGLMTGPMRRQQGRDTCPERRPGGCRRTSPFVVTEQDPAGSGE